MTLKTRNWVKKRVKLTGSWKIKFAKAWKRHLLMNKTKKAKKTNKYGCIISLCEVKRVLRQLPYN